MRISFPLLAIALLVCIPRVAAQGPRLDSPKSATAAPKFRLTSRDNRVRTLETYRGKLLLLNFWATWCGPCREEIPALSNAQNKWGSRGVAIVGVSMDARGWRTVTPFLTNLDVAYEIVLGTPKAARSFGAGEVYPTTVFVSPQSEIIGKVTAALTEEDLDRILSALVPTSGAAMPGQPK